MLSLPIDPTHQKNNHVNNTIKTATSIYGKWWLLRVMGHPDREFQLRNIERV